MQAASQLLRLTYPLCTHFATNLWSRIPFPSTGPASDSQCLTGPDGPLRGLLELEWVGREGLRQEAERESPKVQSGRICCMGEGCSSLQVNWEL